MGWDFDIRHDYLPDPLEKIVSFSSCQGNMLSAIRDKTGKSPTEWTSEFAITELKELIDELDTNNEGKYSDAWCIEADQKWSQGKESLKNWQDYLRFYGSLSKDITYEQYTGTHTRERMRETAFRFLLYYCAGYEIVFNW
jgi:hypothetical protein